MTISNEAIRLTRAQVVALGPCSESRIPKFGRRKTMTASQALDAGASVDDLLWVAGRLGRKDLCVRFALACAQRVAHLNPDARVQAALDATASWLADPTEENRAAAWAAAWAARAARAAWDASNAAAWAAGDAAGDASNAAAWAAGDAAWAARAARAAASNAWDAAWDARAASNAGAGAAVAAEREAQRAIFKEIFG